MKNSWNRIKTPLLVLSICLNVAFVSFWAVRTVKERIGQPGQTVQEPFAPGGMFLSGNIHRELGLNDEQAKTLETHFKQFQTESLKMREEIGALRLQMMELLAAPEFDEDAVRSKQDEILAAQKRMQGLVIDHILAEKELLTPEQRERYFDMICSQCSRHGGPFPGFGGGRGSGSPCPPGRNGRNRNSPSKNR